MVERTRITAAEFSQLPETTQPTQLIEGEIIVSPAPIPTHQIICLRLGRRIEDLMPNGLVFIAPIDLYLDEENMPQPDILWVAENGRCKVTEKRLEGAPELIVEILSPSTARIDRREKFLLYQRHGVTEYWLADPIARFVEVYVLTEGHYIQQGIYDADETFTSAVLGGKTVSLQSIFPKAE